MRNLSSLVIPFPNFSQLIPEQIEPALKKRVTENRDRLTSLLAQSSFTWNNLLIPLEEMENNLHQLWAPVSHLHSVMESDALRSVYNACLPLLTDYQTELLQNEVLYKAFQSMVDSEEYKTLSPAQIKIINNELRDFRLAGVNLEPVKKARFAELQKQINQLSTQFAENLLDATHHWEWHITDLNALAGLPEQALQLARQMAQQRSTTGWILTLDYPCYSAAIKYLTDRALRQRLYEAYVTRASECGPNAGQWDNTVVMEDILKRRQELAQLLGFKNFADYSLVTKMAKNPERVLGFLNDLIACSKSAAEKEMQELNDFATSLDAIDQLEAWDLAYYTEKLREAKYAISQEDLRPYFPIQTVLTGMFTIVNKLYGIHVKECHGIDVWHPLVQVFEIRDAKQTIRGYFYTDLYARPRKRDGAWMDDCCSRRYLADGRLQIPIAFLTCNFTPPLTPDESALLTHDEVQTLFHEFGHCLHHVLTQVNYQAVAGINGVPWDAVEFPSQFFENWCWDKAGLALISKHVKTGEALPKAVYNNLIAAKNFQSGMHMLRQLEFSLFDFCLHLNYDPQKVLQVQATLDEVRQQIAVVPIPPFNRFQHSFSHIFAGGYAAGYYSYLWAEVLSCDAFAQFEEKGIFDSETGQTFLTTVLEQGGVKDPMELFISFRGREPTIDALLKQSGLSFSTE